MKTSSTLFLRIVICLIGLAVLALCAFLLVTLIREDVGGYAPILVGMLIAAMPFFFALFQGLKLLNLIDRSKAFSQSSINSLKRIKFSAIVISLMYGLGMPYIFIVAERDDAPGVVLIGLIFTFGPMVVAVIAAILAKLIQNALDLQSENELTV